MLWGTKMTMCWRGVVGVGTGKEERPHCKGSLTIILHAMCKDGWVLENAEDGKPPVVDE